ncbi:MAG: hypothetical protein OXD32_01715 [Endozoicomonadaceae bacterium]|nr:hypothetical protein [Endozoicomonadaceae bacterium]
MNKVILQILCLIYFFISNYVYAKPHSHDNYVYFTGDTKSVYFHMTNHFITKHQPFKGVFPAGISLKSRTPVPPKGLLIKAGRHGSYDVVEDVENAYCDNIFNAGDSDDQPARSTFAHEPGNLNFAVLGNLIINGKQFNDVVLAQGKAGASNNWWFAGLNCTYYDNSNVYAEAVDCTATDGTDWCFTRGETSQWHSTKPNNIKLDQQACYKIYAK